ncbi:MAG: hypothetical protein Q4G04_00290 [bacterium]|nr:hypothetical protein [bacterium]
MNDSDSELVLVVDDKTDFNTISDDVKYIKFNIDVINKEIIKYFINNGKDYYYSDGYVYVSYDTFVLGNEKIKKILEGIDNNFNELEIVRYLYIRIGKLINYDINNDFYKNDKFSFNKMTTANNIWGCISSGSASNYGVAHLFRYLCLLCNINCEVITVDDKGTLANKLNIIINNKNKCLLVNLMKDIHLIQANFKTKYFGAFNNDIQLDTKVGYIVDNYNDDKIRYVIEDSPEYDILSVLNKIKSSIDMIGIGQVELGSICSNILNSCNFFDVTVNNLYMIDIYNGQREHFVMFTHCGKHYSLSYSKGRFVELTNDDIRSSIDKMRIGIYLNEEIPGI